MSANTVPETEPILTLREVHRLRVDQYHSMISAGVFDEDDQIELLDGVLVNKIPRNPTHDLALSLLLDLLKTIPLNGWCIRGQCGITLEDSEPEPDITVVHGNLRDYARSHPRPTDIGLVIEVANTSLSRDQELKASIYAEAGLPIYWIVNLIDQVVEVYSQPNQAEARYDTRQTYAANDSVPLSLDGTIVSQLRIADFLP